MATCKLFRIAAVVSLAAIALSASVLGAATITPVSVTAMANPASSTGPTDPAELSAFMDDLMPKRLAESQVPGAVVTIVREGKVLFSKGYGYANLEAQVPVNPETTVFRIGSVSKLFIWTAVMQLAEQGQLDLDADINKYLDWRIPDAFGQPITLKHLMTHSAGFEESNFETRATKPETVIPLGTWLKTHMPARVRPPGRISAYSNYGSDLAAYIVQRTSHLAYADYVEQKILNPLGMSHTTALQPPPARIAERLANGYAFSENTYKVSPDEYAHATASGFMDGSAADMARFMSAYLQDGEYQGVRILKAETAQQMRTRLLTLDPRINGFRYGFYEMSQNGVEIYGHAGDTTAFHSILALFPTQKMGLFLSYNGVGTPYIQEKTLEAFVNHYFPAPPPPTPNPVLNDAPRVAGPYRSLRSSYTSMEKVLWLLGSAQVTAMPDGKIQYSSGLEEPKTFVEVEPLVFRQIDADNTLVFHANAAGEIIAAAESARPTRTMEPFPWYENPTLHLAILGIGYMLMLSVLVVALIRMFRWLRHRTTEPLPARVAYYALVAAALLAFAFLLIFPIDEGSRIAFTQGQVTIFIVAMLFSTLVAVLTPVVVIGAALAWLRGFWGMATRVHYTLATLGLVGLTISFFTWNLVGWNF